MSDFAQTITEAYAAEGAAIDLGRGVHEDKLDTEAVVQVPLRMMNRHGLVAGATGTGKTITLQTIAEQLSAAGVPVFAADVKGDVSGVERPRRARRAGREADERARARPSRRRASRSSTCRSAGSGPACRCAPPCPTSARSCSAKVLEANETQEQSLALVFHYADQKGLPLLDLSDLRALLTFLESDAGKEELEGIGGLASSTVGVLLRSARGARDRRRQRVLRRAAARDRRPDAHGARTAAGSSPASSCRPSRTGRGSSPPRSCGCWPSCSSSCPRPATSTSRSSCSSSTRRTCSSTTPPRRSSSRSTQTVRLIRSKGVGVFFVTQVPDDVPARGAGPARQPRAARAAGLHARRRQGAQGGGVDLSDLRLLRRRGAAHPMGIGEAAVTILSEDGVPTPVVHTRLRAPASRMGPADDVEGAAKASPLFAKYGTRVESESAREKLAARMEAGARARGRPSPGRRRRRPPAAKAQKAPRRHGRRRRRARRLPDLARGQGAPAQGGARRVRDAAKAAVSARPRGPRRRSPAGHSAVHRRARGPARGDPRASWPRSCARTRRSGRTRAGSPTRCSRAWRELGLLGLKYPEEYGGRGGGYVDDAVLDRGARRAAARAGSRPGSAPTSGSPRRRSGSSAPRTRSSASSRRRSAASGSPRSASPSRAPARTWPASARSRRRGRRRLRGQRRRRPSSRTACAPTSSSPRSRPPRRAATRGSPSSDREGDGGLLGLEQAREARLARLGHRRAGVRGRVRARGEPARRGEQGLLPDHGQLPVGAAADGARRRGLDGGRARAAWLEAAPRASSEVPAPHGGGDGAQAGGLALPDRLRALPVRHGARRDPRGDRGQAALAALRLRGGRGRLPDHATATSRSAGPCATRGWGRSAAAPTR